MSSWIYKVKVWATQLDLKEHCQRPTNVRTIYRFTLLPLWLGFGNSMFLLILKPEMADLQTNGCYWPLISMQCLFRLS